MFSGIVEALGTVQAIEKMERARRLWIHAPFVEEITLGSSIAHNGACLTVVAVKHRFYCVEVVEETLQRTNLGKLQVGDIVNVERSLPLGARVEGHLVQGHIDTTLEVIEVEKVGEDSYYFTFELPESWSHLVVEKGSIALDGVSLTVASVQKGAFRVAIIPWTYTHTTFSRLRKGMRVNVEFDIMAKYLWQWSQRYLPQEGSERS
ncbi:MAG: riboflavin synthase [Bacteroidia bacterium]|nr:riboflavin synthase [Bacteroidia bacterium]MDW8236088.1 riboflavin synthase [Bacteroidia bacterium]